jgi:hypothetical protein
MKMMMMTMLNRLAFACLICASLILVRAQSLPRINREEDARSRELISEGLGVGRIYVGRSTAEDVATVHGKTFETIEHGAYSYEMRYAPLGLSFWYCREDPQKRIFDINAVTPFNGFTARGVSLGKSTLRDVFKAYGETEPTASSKHDSWTFAYPGVEFTIPYKDIQGKAVSALLGAKVTAIDVTTSRGGSYCDTSKPK